MQWQPPSAPRGPSKPELQPILRPDRVIQEDGLAHIKAATWSPERPRRPWVRTTLITVLLSIMSIISLLAFFSLGLGINGLPHARLSSPSYGKPVNPIKDTPIKNVVCFDFYQLLNGYPSRPSVLSNTIGGTGRGEPEF
ncbi:hypothetical protein BDV38DRAFT_205102 [Aspergillus pseudotamarii]|uniref:Uncharacterized protein n=1 Tax=Aspergillus pseudotamarii TaxID=132259 RepID=A0A5N6T536_ASPPS|nr:uncharacterized protein BDV38DRAFT_205102 [Aspergillus pseudotamarii]KAE8141426.1 hypothetical protein BDV38DRAFT_205102 [Aspergillus pseudotamarii]